MSALFMSTRFMSRPIRAQKDLFMSVPIHVRLKDEVTKPQLAQTKFPHLIRFQGSVRLSEVGLG